MFVKRHEAECLCNINTAASAINMAVLTPRINCSQASRPLATVTPNFSDQAVTASRSEDECTFTNNEPVEKIPDRGFTQRRCCVHGLEASIAYCWRGEPL